MFFPTPAHFKAISNASVPEFTPKENFEFKKEFTFDSNKNDDDLNFENILIDKTSADLLKGSEVDYVSELIGETFKITNPQTKSSCGCGVSFSL